MKKIISIILTLSLFISSFPVPLAQAAVSNQLSLDLGPVKQSGTIKQKQKFVIQELTKEEFRPDEEVTIMVANPDDEALIVEVFDSTNKKAEVAIKQDDTVTGESFTITPQSKFAPGEYKVVVTDKQGNKSEQNFTWGVLALNTDRSIYLPKQTAQLSFAVLDNKGDMVCDARLNLEIKTPKGTIHKLGTQTGEITTNDQCRSHDFSLEPDYQATYEVGSPGTYTLTLKAQTGNGDYSITDSIIVQETVPFDVQRQSATRIYPPHHYPVNLTITANEDFTGVITETVPASFTIAPAEKNQTYKTMQTVYLDNETDPKASVSQSVLGAATTALALPFSGPYPITQGFGEQMTEPDLLLKYITYGISGHDGIDFGTPMGTPIYAVDEGNVLWAGPGDYGITVIIQHSWGRSYYGHLQEVTVEKDTHITKGTKIALSGNTGESTGPHLHFSIKPNNPDMENGYLGKIDPLPYLTLSQPTAIAENFPLDETKVLGATTSAERTTKDTEASASAIQLPQQTEASTSATNSFTVSEKQLLTGAFNQAATENAEKVKVLQWEVSLKKGETTTLSYQFKAPNISPQFYLLGPLRFYKNTPEKGKQLIFSENRHWQIAGDAVGTRWYNYNWQYRKQITVDDTKVPYDMTATTINFMESGTDATRDLNFYNNAFDNDPISDCTTSKTGPCSIKMDTGGSAQDSVVEKSNAVGDSGTRFSFYFKMDEFTTSGGQGLMEVYNSTNTTYVVTPLEMNTSHQLKVGEGSNVSSTALQTGVWYRITVAYTITSTTVNQFRIYINGELEVSESNLTISSTGSNYIRFGLFGSGNGANVTQYLDDIYSDSGSDLSDPGDIRVTHKRPNAENVNNFDTAIGNARGATDYNNINEQPLSQTNGWRHNNTTDVAENYGIQNVSTGDVDITNKDILARSAWVWAAKGAATTCTADIYNNGTATAITLTTTPAMYTNNVVSSTYPSNAAAVGMSSCTAAADTLYYESGMHIAYAEDGEIANFPVLVNLTTDTNLVAAAQTNANDILFTDSTGTTKLSHEIEKYTSSTGELVAWVKVPTLTTGSDTILYMYYGNKAAANQEDVTNVWSSSYNGVWHLSEDPSGTAPQMDDSTSNANDLTSNGMTSGDQIAGQIDGSLDFDGTNDSLSDTDNASFTPSTNMTLSAWVKFDLVNATTRKVIYKGHNADPWYSYFFEIDTGDDINFFWVNNSSTNYTSDYTGTVTAGTWYYVTGVKSSSAVQIYINASTANTTTGTPTGTLFDSNDNFMVANNFTGGTEPLNGDIDEIRLASTARSSSWITTEYNNQSSPSTFYTLGSQETKLYAGTLEELMRHGEILYNGTKQPLLFAQ